MQEELDCCQQECSAFQDQLQLQRESAALSSKRIQQGCYKKQKQLVQRVQELQGNLKEVSVLQSQKTFVNQTVLTVNQTRAACLAGANSINGTTYNYRSQ